MPATGGCLDTRGSVTVSLCLEFGPGGLATLPVLAVLVLPEVSGRGAQCTKQCRLASGPMGLD